VSSADRGGSTELQASVDAWKPWVGTRFTYEWRKDQNPIAGSEGKSLVVDGAGSYHVRVTARRAGYATTSVESETFEVHPNDEAAPKTHR
jgi:hypothetical protein